MNLTGRGWMGVLLIVAGVIVVIAGMLGLANAGAVLSSVEAALVGSIPGLLLIVLGCLLVASGSMGGATKPNRRQLQDLLSEVTTDLREAEQKADNSRAIMKFSECELDMAVDWEVSAEGKTTIWVVEAKGGLKRSESNTIKVKFQALPNVSLAYIAKALAVSQTAPTIEAPGQGVPGQAVEGGIIVQDDLSPPRA
ncbi:MAG: hypothetical protein JO352_31850 [Chloroflexi bacterium]|nr:hypothetical protein [Chloroflexota bacterium]MBV9602634.1 hypothetical protein [Chloroflexota bacterium]